MFELRRDPVVVVAKVPVRRPLGSMSHAWSTSVCMAEIGSPVNGQRYVHRVLRAL